MSDKKPTEPAESGADIKAEAETKTTETEASAEKTQTFPLALYQPSSRYRRPALIAASLTLAAGLGAFAGALGAYGFAAAKTDAVEPTRNLQAALTQVTKDVGALKASVDAANRAVAGQMAKINERFDRSDKAQAEPAARIAALTDSVAKLEKRIAANAEAARDITGSVSQHAPASPAKDQSKPPIVEGWILRDAYRGRALLENRRVLYEVSPGADLPGVGRVQNITQQDGRWVVVTPKGLIVSMR